LPRTRYHQHFTLSWRWLLHQVSISLTLYVQIFRRNVVFSSHMYVEKRRSYKKFVLITLMKLTPVEFWCSCLCIKQSVRFKNWWYRGWISSTYLRAAFTPVAPQCVRTQSSRQYLFMLLGSAHVKAVHRTLMKLSLGL